MFKLVVGDLTISSWICHFKLWLRSSCFSGWVFLDGSMFKLKVEDLNMDSFLYGFCSVWKHWYSSMGFCVIWKLRILPGVLGFIFWIWAFGPVFFFPNKSSWTGFCLAWRLGILPWVLAFVFWDWACGPAAFIKEPSWIGFCLVRKVRTLLWVLGFVFRSWAFGPAFFLMSLVEWVSV